MSKNCNYVYVQGLRFRPQAVTVLWKHTDGIEYQVQLRKTGTGFAQCDENGIPLSVTPKDLKRVLKQGDTINVIVHAMSDSNTEYEKVMLHLDPRLAEGRKGRKAFDAGSLTGLPSRALRALALEQLKTAPYGAENRDQAVERILWGLENLDDAAIAKMLAEAEVGYTSRSSTNAELAALLLSDQVLVASLMRDGKHESLRGLLQIAPLATATLAGVSRPAEEALAEAALSIVYDRPNSPSGDPAVYRHALGYVTDPAVLSDLVFDPDPKVRTAAFTCFKEIAPKGASDSLLKTVALRDSDPAVRTAAVCLIDSTEVLRDLASKTMHETNAAVFAATLEQLRSVDRRQFKQVVEKDLLRTDRDDYTWLPQQLSDEALEHLVGVGVAVSAPAYQVLAAVHTIADQAVQLRVANNTALPTVVRAEMVKRIADAQERAWFTDPIHPTEVRCAAIQGYVTEEGVGYLSQRRLLELLRDHDPAVRITTAEVVQDESALREMAVSDKAAAGAAAESLRAMGAHKPEVLVTILPEVLATSLGDRTFDTPTRQQIFKVARQTVQDQQEMLNQLRDPAASSNETAVALVRATHIEAGMQQIRAALRDVALTETDSEVASSGYYALTGMDPEAAETVARTALSPEVRLMAARDMAFYVTYSTNEPASDRTVRYRQALIDLATSDADSEVGVTAAEGISDQKALSEILESAPNEHVRTALVQKIVSPRVLVRTLQNDASELTRMAATRRFASIADGGPDTERVLHTVAQEDSSPEVRKAALGFVTTSSVLDTIALRDADPEVRIAALARVSNQSVLSDIARSDTSTEVRIAALKLVNNRAVLADIATNDADARIRACALSQYNKY
jgi:hypothetical protein